MSWVAFYYSQIKCVFSEALCRINFYKLTQCCFRSLNDFQISVCKICKSGMKQNHFLSDRDTVNWIEMRLKLVFFCMKREAFNKANFVTQFYTKSAVEGTVNCGVKAEVAKEHINCLDNWFCRKPLGLKKFVVEQIWEYCASCGGDIAENMVTHAWGGIFLGCFRVKFEWIC